MAKLAKIRLTGCKYDGLRKEHEDSIFDLTKDGRADHSLFTLCNGGGKGVMMQLIFQLLLPETRWGKNNGNKVISMFFDQRGNLIPFTFHVGLEWILDTIPEKRLITGIAAKAIIKNTNKEEGDKTGLTLFLYSHEYENDSYFKLENLPLYDKDKGEAVDIDILDEFIRANSRDFIRYSQSSVRRIDSDYFKYLESRGIYRSEWLNLKDINKLEGGAGDYFTGAGDNKSIFDKIIIPAISENIKNFSYDDGDSLIEMFRSNLSITKDLPILIKREGDYKKLLSEIKPLVENADLGSRYNRIRDRLIEEGNDIYFILKDEDNLIVKEIKKWENEQKISEIEIREQLFSKDNLHYNLEKRTMEGMEKTLRTLEGDLKNKSYEITDKKQEKLIYQINRILFNKKRLEDEIAGKNKERESLLQALKTPDILEKIEDLDREIEDEWHREKDKWFNIENQFNGYINYIRQVMEENNKRKNNYQERINGLQQEVNKYELKREDFNRRKSQLARIYSPLNLLYPDRIHEDLLKSEENYRDEVESINNSLVNWRERLSLLDKDLTEANLLLKGERKDIELLEEKILEGEKEELGLAREIASRLLENQEAGLLSYEWFDKKTSQLKLMEDEKGLKLDLLQREIWERNIEKSLNKADYFIANKDILEIREAIESLDINVESGSQYLKNVEEEERLKLLRDNPGFFYSLVIENQKDWDLIKKNISGNLFINNMVPIYLRSEMGSHNCKQFQLVYSSADDLVDESLYWAWKSKIEEELEGLKETETKLRDDLEDIGKTIRKIEIIKTRDLVLVLNHRLREKEDKILGLLDRIRIDEEESGALNNKIEIEEGRLEKYRNKLLEISESIKEIKDYMDRLEVIEREKKLIENVEKEIKDLSIGIENLEYDNKEISYRQDEVGDSYSYWKIEINSIIKEVREIYQDWTYDYGRDASYVSHRIPDFTMGKSSLGLMVKERKLIEGGIQSKNMELALVEKDISHKYEELAREVDNLEELSESWMQYKDLGLGLAEILVKIKELGRKIKKLENEKIEIQSKRDGNLGKLEIMNEKILEKETEITSKHGKAPFKLDIEDLEREIHIKENAVKEKENYLKACKETLEKNTIRRMKLEVNLSKIKHGYPLDIRKGKLNKLVKPRIKENPDLAVDEWLRKCENNRANIEGQQKEGEGLVDSFIREVDNKLEENSLKKKLISTIKGVKIRNFTSNLASFKSMENHFQKELLSLSNDKSKAEEAMRQWTNRASIHVIKIIEALKDMVATMNYTNEQGYIFPLVKLKGLEKLPKKESEISYLLDEYFIEAISKILEKGLDISNIGDRELKSLMDDKVIFSKALQGRYPTLLVYKMSEKNEFRYARARDEYYTSWEAINKGEGDLPEGSGGQTLSVNTFVIMMIMSFKKRHIGNVNPSTILILDNPFGKASARHVLDPIFQIADKLKFQLICFAAPEIIKVEISERFPIFWELKIEDGKIIHGGRIIKY